MRRDHFERLYAEQAPALFAFLAYRTGDRQLAQDLMADTFERAFRARGRFDRRKAREKTWLYAIALNVLRDHQRRMAVAAKASERLVHVTEPGAEDPGLAAIGVRDELRRALAQLSPEEREAVALRFGADLTVPEMAATLGVALTTVEGRIARALRKLRQTLGAEPPAASGG